MCCNVAAGSSYITIGGYGLSWIGMVIMIDLRQLGAGL